MILEGISLLNKLKIPNFLAPAARQKRGYFEVLLRAEGARKFWGILTISRGKTTVFRVPNAPKAREILGYFERFQRVNRQKIGDFLGPRSREVRNPPPLVKDQIFEKGGGFMTRNYGDRVFISLSIGS